MIARIWRGRVWPHKAGEYFEFMMSVAVPDYQSCAGNRGVWCLRSDEANFVNVTMITLWDDIESIRAFAGEPVTMAKYYDFDRDYLLSLPQMVEHHEVYGWAQP